MVPAIAVWIIWKKDIKVQTCKADQQQQSYNIPNTGKISGYSKSIYTCWISRDAIGNVISNNKCGTIYSDFILCCTVYIYVTNVT